MKIYVDVDGTLLDGSLDKMFKERCVNEEFSVVLAWYENCEIDNLELNMDLIKELITLREEGNELILWTNRGEENREMTKRNLGIYWNMFNSYEFHSGKKSKCVLEGLVIDNEERFSTCGTSFRLIDFK